MPAGSPVEDLEGVQQALTPEGLFLGSSLQEVLHGSRAEHPVHEQRLSPPASTLQSVPYQDVTSLQP